MSWLFTFAFVMTMLPFMSSTRFFRSWKTNKPSMYVLINLEGVWEVKFELLNEIVHIPPPPPHSVNISARVLCFSTTYPKREHFFEFFCGKEVCMESFSFDRKRSVGKKACWCCICILSVSLFQYLATRIHDRITILASFPDKEIFRCWRFSTNR